MLRIWMRLWPLMALGLSACAHPPTAPEPPRLTLTAADRTAAADPVAPVFGPLDAPRASGIEERAYLFETVIAPLLAFSLRQEATVASERERAEALIAKVDALGQAQAELEAEPHRRRLFGR